MRKKTLSRIVASLVLAIVVSTSLAAARTSALRAAADNDSGAAALERLKSLAGRWTGGEGGAAYALELDVVAGGKTVVAREFPGTDHEMTTVYYLRGSELVAQHYCMLGNQPRFRHLPTSDRDEVRFVFDGGDNLDPARDEHAHEGFFRLHADGALESKWSFWKDGKEHGAESFLMRREE